MGSLKRQINRKKNLKNLKRAKKNLKSALSATMGLPTNCTGCGDNFDPVEDASTWMVAVYEEGVHLNCPSCYEKVSALD